MDQAELDSLCGARTNLLLSAELVDLTGVNFAVIILKKIKFRASLFKKSERAVVWQGAGSGATNPLVAGPILSIANANLRMVAEFAIERAFESLPSIITHED